VEIRGFLDVLAGRAWEMVTRPNNLEGSTTRHLERWLNFPYSFVAVESLQVRSSGGHVMTQSKGFAC
jgi:hypothetical protein